MAISTNNYCLCTRNEIEHARAHARTYARTHTPHTHTRDNGTHIATNVHSSDAAHACCCMPYANEWRLSPSQPLHMQGSPYHTTCEPRTACQTNNNTTTQLLQSIMTSRSTRKQIYKHVSNMCLKLDKAASGACKWRTQGMTKRTKHTQTMPRKGSMHPAMGRRCRPAGDSSCR